MFFSNLKKFSLKKINFSLIFFSLLIFSSCQNSVPKGSSVNAKIIYDFESEYSKPIQKLSFFFKMESDTRRIDFINLYHEETGFRWIIDEPLITKADNFYYAGYTNCVSKNNLPQGKYCAYYVDSKEQDLFLTFDLTYDENFSEKTYADSKNQLMAKNGDIFLGLYSTDGKVIFYDRPLSNWEKNKSKLEFNDKEIFKYNKDVNFYRIFINSKSEVYILPKIEKSN